MEQAIIGFEKFLRGQSLYTRCVYQKADNHLRYLLFIDTQYPNRVFGIENDKEYPSVGVLFIHSEQINFGTFDFSDIRANDTALYQITLDMCRKEAETEDNDEVYFENARQAIRKFARQHEYLLNLDRSKEYTM